MNDHTVSKKVYITNLKGEEIIGRSQTRWEDDFREEGTGQEA